jgi:hypothetical protein
MTVNALKKNYYEMICLLQTVKILCLANNDLFTLSGVQLLLRGGKKTIIICYRRASVGFVGQKLNS